MTAKDTVRALLDRLPEDCNLDDVQYHPTSCKPSLVEMPTNEKAARFLTSKSTPSCAGSGCSVAPGSRVLMKTERGR